MQSPRMFANMLTTLLAAKHRPTGINPVVACTVRVTVVIELSIPTPGRWRECFMRRFTMVCALLPAARRRAGRAAELASDPRTIAATKLVFLSGNFLVDQEVDRWRRS